jgi:hypothetical protein
MTGRCPERKRKKGMTTRVDPSRRVRKMRANTAMAMLTALTMMVMVAIPATAQDPSHGGSLTNTHNDLYIVHGDAENPDDIDAGYGFMYVEETISFANDDPLKVPDYGIVYVDPTYSPDPDTPIVTKYTYDYTIANYTLQLFNITDDYVGNFTGFEGTTAALLPGIDLGPEGAEEPHPKVNATYMWQVWAVTEENRQLQNEFGGEMTTEIFNATVFDWSDLLLPEIGPHSYEADQSDLFDMTMRSLLVPHESLSEGWYKYQITDEVFEYGVALTIELRYTGEVVGDRILLNKLVFTQRTIHVDVYHDSGLDVLLYSDVEAKGEQVSPTKVSTGSGDPTAFTYELTFSLVVQEEGTDGTDWNLYGRYALLGILIVALLFLVLWSGRGKGSGAEEDEDGDEEMDEERAKLMERKATILAQIKELDHRHDEGEIGEGVWKRKRKSLKGQAVDVMRELEGPEGADGPSDEGPAPAVEYTGDRAELEAEKEEVLERIRELDARHDAGELADPVWKRKRKGLKVEAVEIMKEIEELEEEGVEEEE